MDAATIDLQLALTVIVTEKARLAAVAALDHMLRNAGKIESGQAGHVDHVAWLGEAGPSASG